MKTYKPTQSDIDWLEGTFNLLKDGGLWGIPNSLSVFRVNKQTRTLTLAKGDINDPTNQRIVMVAEAAGWKVKEETHETT